MSSFTELELAVIRWSEARRIIPNSTALAQALKAVEEVNELVAALIDDNREEAIDGAGDILVCLINVCALMDVNLTDCLAHSYSQIQHRKGTLGKDGIFYKEI